MDAQIYQLDDMRSRHNTQQFMATFFQTPLALDGLALIVSATSFWVEYVGAMALFHHRLVSQPCLPDLK